MSAAVFGVSCVFAVVVAVVDGVRFLFGGFLGVLGGVGDVVWLGLEVVGMGMELILSPWSVLEAAVWARLGLVVMGRGCLWECISCVRVRSACA
jgi:hypothetical protein